MYISSSFCLIVLILDSDANPSLLRHITRLQTRLSSRIGCVINKNPDSTDIIPLSPTPHHPASINKSHTIVMLTEHKHKQKFV